MKIESITKQVVYFVETDGVDFPNYTRYGPNSWMVSMGMSDETVYNCSELEAAFQEFNSICSGSGLDPFKS